MSTDDSRFYLDPDSGNLYLVKRVDYEKTRLIELTVMASDDGKTTGDLSLNSTAIVVISIINVNDNAPLFDVDHFEEFTFSSRIACSTFIGRLTAYDADIDDLLNFKLISGDANDQFRLDTDTGVLTTAPHCNKVTFSDSYLLNISVTDRVHMTFKEFRVTVQPSPLDISALSFSQQIYYVNVNEDALKGFKVRGNYRATYKDYKDMSLSDTANITYKLISDMVAPLFTIDYRTGSIYCEGSLDRELKNTHVLPIIATDNTGKIAFMKVIVNVTDVNDNEPYFKVKSYRANVKVTSKVGDFVLSVKAFDDDVGYNSTIVYTLIDNEDGLFTIDQNVGSIRISKPLNVKEGNELVQLFVRANDKGHRSKSKTIPVEIMLIQPDTKIPVFPSTTESYLFIKDTLAIGSVVINIEMPLWPTKLRYSLANQNTPFAINKTSACIIVQQNIENFSANKYVLYVLASTLDIPHVVGKLKVKIRIKRTKNKAPVFDSKTYEFPISEATAIGTKLAEVRATDKQSVRYSMKEENQYFTIDPISGMIKTNDNLDKETIAIHTLIVIAREKRSGLESTTTVKIPLVDVNDMPPVFKKPLYKAYAYEDASIGTVLSNIVAHDGDSDSVIRYSVVSGDRGGIFHMNGNGDLILSRGESLDFESRPKYDSLTIAAMDDVHVAVTHVVIEIRNVNDNPPICELALYKRSVSESIDTDTKILTIKATDADGDNLTFTILNNNKFFSINKKSGVIRSKHLLDREKLFIHKLRVRASDSDGHSCESSVEIVLEDVNDNPPTFDEAIKVGRNQVVVFENAKKNTVLARFAANDKDLGKNRMIRYSLMNNLDVFSIDKFTAILTLKSRLDREKKSTYNVTVKATDQGIPRMTTTAYIRVRVLDINDNPPIFTQGRYHATVSENTSTGSEVQVSILATSRDSGINAEIVYAIVSGNDWLNFEIDSSNGRVTIAKMLDYETTKTHSLVIKARDRGDQPLWVTTVLEVKVTDYNDNAPTFTKPTYHLRLSEDAKLSSTHHKYKAEDLDRDQNAVIHYSILRGDIESQFSIDKNTGELSIVNKLDREQISEYTLILQVVDNGVPSLSSTAELVIDIEDVNDSPPVFVTDSDALQYVPENRNYGYIITKLHVTDADSINNGGPFTYDIVKIGRNFNHFGVDKNGQVFLKTKLNRSKQSEYALNISAQDSGNPYSLKGYVLLKINVVEPSIHPPVIQLLNVTVLIPPGHQYIPVGASIATIIATDQDKYDKLLFTRSDSWFDLNSKTGELTVSQKLSAGRYDLNISVNDNRFTTYGLISVNIYQSASPIALNSAVVVTVSVDTLTDAKVIGVRDAVVSAIGTALNVKPSYITILSIQPANHRSKRDTRDELDILLVLRTSRSGSFMPSKHLKQNLNQYVNNINARLSDKGILIVQSKRDVCNINTCSGHGKCKPKISFTDTQTSYSNGSHSIVTVNHKVYPFCRCERGYAGDICDILGSDSCSINPCDGDQICKANKNGYTCVCPAGGCGVQNRNTLTFYGKSFTSWLSSVPMTHQLRIQVKVKTSQDTRGTLFYVDGGTPADNFYCLEILNRGLVQFRYKIGKVEGRVKVNSQINDGKWHSIELLRTRKKIILDIDNGATFKKSSLKLGENGLQIDSRVFYIGANVTDVNEQTIEDGFIGCLKDFKVAEQPLSMSQNNRRHVATYIANRNIEFGCGPLSTIQPINVGCGLTQCKNGGRCSYSQVSRYHCLCPVGFTGTRCEMTCPAGLTGDNCNLDLDECAVKRCANEAICINTYGGFKCDCTVSGTHGKLCDQYAMTGSISNDHRMIIIILIAVLLIVLLAAAIFIIIMRCRWQRKNQRNQQQESDVDRCYENMKNRNRNNKSVTMEQSQRSFMQTRPPPVPNRPISYTPSSVCGSVGAVNSPEVIPLLMRNGAANEDQLGNDIHNMKIPEYMESVWGTKDPKDGAIECRGSPGPTPPPRYHDIIHSGAGFTDRTMEYGEKRSLLAPNACLLPDDEHNDYHWDQYDLKNTKTSPTPTRPDDIDTEADSNVELYDVTGVDLFDLSGGANASCDAETPPVIAFIDDEDCNNSEVDEDLLDDAQSFAEGVGTYRRLIKEHQNIQYEITDEDEEDKVTDIPLTEYTTTPMSYLPDFPDPETPLATRALATATVERRPKGRDPGDDVEVRPSSVDFTAIPTIPDFEVDPDVIKTFI